jgi:hypothetical protein
LPSGLLVAWTGPSGFRAGEKALFLPRESPRIVLGKILSIGFWKAAEGRAEGMQSFQAFPQTQYWLKAGFSKWRHP